SPGSAREAAERLASQQGQDCVTGSFGAGAGGMPGTVTAIALPIGGSVGYRGDAGLPGGVTASFDFVALHRGKAVAFLISGGVAPRPPDAPLTLLAPLAASMEQSLGDEAA
ncbi:MAG TPA: hypothetical protein VHE80_07595, partial [Acidimicrobiales bacterium]|nr:hypothetical protein [Acidimicrobiales bacterium]